MNSAQAEWMINVYYHRVMFLFLFTSSGDASLFLNPVHSLYMWLPWQKPPVPRSLLDNPVAEKNSLPLPSSSLSCLFFFHSAAVGSGQMEQSMTKRLN